MTLNDTLGDPRIEPDVYIVRPTGYDDLVHSDKDAWCLRVMNGHNWGWAVRRHFGGDAAMNRKGKWIYENRGSGHNKARRFTLDEALQLALKYVDTHTINGFTAAQASASIAARRAAQGESAT